MYGATDPTTEPLFPVEESPEPEVESSERVGIPGWAVLLAFVLMVVPGATLWYFGNDKPVNPPASSAPPATSTMIEIHKETIIREVGNPAQSEASRPDKKAAAVAVTTGASSALTQTSSSAATLPSASPSVSDTSSAPSTTAGLPTITTSASSAPTTSATTSASKSEAP